MICKEKVCYRSQSVSYAGDMLTQKVGPSHDNLSWTSILQFLLEKGVLFSAVMHLFILNRTRTIISRRISPSSNRKNVPFTFVLCV